MQQQSLLLELIGEATLDIFEQISHTGPDIVNRTQSNPIDRWIEFDWVRQSNEIELAEKEKNQSNPIERSNFELMHAFHL